MLEKDAFSQWLGIRLISTKPGKTILEMQVRPEMLNGFSLAHGGITYSLADSCLAFAANGRGIQSLSVETSIAHTAPVKAGDILVAEAFEEQTSNSFGRYRIRITRKEDNKLVALFNGTVYKTGKPWVLPEEK